MHSNIDICHRYYWNQSINAKTNWSWICYYYPSQSETHLDHNMIYKACAFRNFIRTSEKEKFVITMRQNFFIALVFIFASPTLNQHVLTNIPFECKG
ncbi:unnamed protein product, partial [Rotaria magnacalcarata]